MKYRQIDFSPLGGCNAWMSKHVKSGGDFFLSEILQYLKMLSSTFFNFLHSYTSLCFLLLLLLLWIHFILKDVSLFLLFCLWSLWRDHTDQWFKQSCMLNNIMWRSKSRLQYVHFLWQLFCTLLSYICINEGITNFSTCYAICQKPYFSLNTCCCILFFAQGRMCK